MVMTYNSIIHILQLFGTIVAKLLPDAHLFDYAKCNVLLDVAWLNEVKPLLLASVCIVLHFKL